MNASPDWSSVRSSMTGAVSDGVFPGAVLLVAAGERILFHEAFGVLEAGGAATSVATIYDVSSLTKPLVTQACLLTLAADGKLSLDQAVGDLLPEFVAGADPRRREVTIASLLAHRSGLPARPEYFKEFSPTGAAEGNLLAVTHDASKHILGRAIKEPLVAPPGTFAEYSDAGFLVLGALVEALRGAPLDEVFTREFGSSPVSAAGRFVPLVRARASDGDWRRSVAPTGYCPWRKRIVRAEVQDENAWAMGGIAGHAGLFATAADIHRLTLEYVKAYAGEVSRLQPSLVRECWRGPVARDSSWALGWDTPTPGASSAGRHVSRRAFGHLGFTGSSVWVDAERGVQVVLLSNRIQAGVDNAAIRAFRPRLHDAVFAAVDATGPVSHGWGSEP